MTPVLEIIEGENRVTRYDLTQEETYIGRDPKCDIVIRDARISRTHARLWWEGGVLRLEDCRSRNGTKVNGRELQKSGSVQLGQGDVIQICNTLFRFRAPPTLAHESIPDDSTSIRCTIDATSTYDVALPANAERKLRAILQVTEALGATLDEKLVLSRVLRALLEVFPRAERGLVLLREGPELAPKAVERRIEREERVVYSKTLIDKVVRGRQAVLSEDVGRDPSIPSADSISDLQLRSIMCVPLLSHGGDVLGVIQLDTRKEKAEFDVDDVRVLTCVAAQVSGFVEIVRLHQEIVKHERIRQELNFAREVQFQFLPRTTPNVPGYCFWAFYEPARRVGGDFYNFLELPNGTSAFLLGDAAGKGAPASLVMVWVSWLCKAALLRHPGNLVDAMQAVNAEMSDFAMEASFVTLAVGQLNPATHQATFASAGHMSPIICRSGSVIEKIVDTGSQGYPLGTERDLSCKAVSTILAPGDFVVLFSDGVTDQVNATQEQYSGKRLRALLSATAAQGPEDVGQAVLDDVRRHMTGCDQTDDMSLVVLQRRPVA